MGILMLKWVKEIAKLTLLVEHLYCSHTEYQFIFIHFQALKKESFPNALIKK